MLQLLLTLALAAPFATLTQSKGTVLLDGKPSPKAFTKAGKLTTGPDSFARITFKDKTVLTIGAEAEMELVPPLAKPYTFLKGRCRWKSGSKKKKWIQVSTKNAVMGVRGTDFMVVATPLLGETEIVVKSGAVDFGKPNTKPTLIKAMHWGGLGGRFGKTVGKPVRLSSKTVEALVKDLN